MIAHTKGEVSCVSSTFRTISSQLDSFQVRPCIYPTPQQLAEAGFYYVSHEEDVEVVGCFSCGMESEWGDPGREITSAELQKALLTHHEEGCLWINMRRDATAHSVVPPPSSPRPSICSVLSSRTSPEPSTPPPQARRKRKMTATICNKNDRETDADLVEEVKRI